MALGSELAHFVDHLQNENDLAKALQKDVTYYSNGALLKWRGRSGSLLSDRFGVSFVQPMLRQKLSEEDLSVLTHDDSAIHIPGINLSHRLSASATGRQNLSV